MALGYVRHVGLAFNLCELNWVHSMQQPWLHSRLMELVFLLWLLRSIAQISVYFLDVLVSSLLHPEFVSSGRVVRCRAFTWMATTFHALFWDSRLDF